MTTSVKSSIDILKKAQELDRQIYQAEVQLRSLPEERAKIKRELDLERQRLTQLEGDLKKTQLKQKEKEGELGQKEANIKKLEAQLGAVKTNKEYSALQQEISSLKADNAVLEEEIIKFFDQVEAVEEEVKKEKERLKQVEKESQTREGEMAQKEKAASETVQSLKSRRDDIVKDVAPDIKNLYNLIVQKKQGLALVKVNGEICGACQLQLRPQLLNEVRMAEAVVVCENCSRILYFEE